MAQKMKHTKGERLNIRFNRKIKLEFHGAKLTSDGGLLAYRELDDALRLFDSVSALLSDRRTGRNIQHDITNLLRQSVYSRLAGYEDVNDAQRLSVDPVMRAVTGKKKNAASTNTMGRFETEILALKENLDGLSGINGSWVERAMEKTPHHRIILDMDSSESPVHGEQEGSAYNGHFRCSCYHPLFCFNQYGDCEGAILRPGNVHSADRWKELLEPIVRRYENKKVRKYFRGDAAFVKPEIYEYLEENGLLHAIRLPANDVLYDEIKHLLTRPVGRPSRKPVVWFHDFKYQAASWQKRRRVVAKVEWHQGDLFPRVGFIVTNMSTKAEGVVQFYNGRGIAEQWIKEGKYALNWTRLSCKQYISNQARLCLFVLAYNLGNFLRRLALPGKIKRWSLRSLLVKLIKIGAKVLRHSRYVIFQMAEVAIRKEIFAEILYRISRLRCCSV
ncbi:MAG: IS1380 family transposase [Candidatus Aminicenantes bacterium]|nr:IS1380 family transposase [Candidatus Aminicenantes bacterium]